RISSRREQADGERPTRSASSALEIRPFCCTARRIAASIASRCVIRIFLENPADIRRIFDIGPFRKPPLHGHFALPLLRWFPPQKAAIKREPTGKGTRMRVGCPKEIKNHEYRVGLTPGAVREYVAHGHEVIVETKAGAGIGADDDAYRAAGAKIAPTAADVFQKSDMVVKVKEPQPFEWTQLHEGQILYT